MKNSSQKNRYEWKYMLSDRTLKAAVQFLSRNLPLAVYDDKTVSHVYSLYFDTENLETYHFHKMSEKDRFKLRFRTYSHVVGPDTYGFLELKQKENSLVKKSRVRLQLLDVLELLAGRQAYEFWEKIHDLNPDDKTAWNIFQTNAARIEKGHFVPRTAVAYQRLSFQKPDGLHRVTIDDRLHFAKAETIEDILRFPASTAAVGDLVILESKYGKESQPQWFQNEIDALKLEQTSFSKYVNSVELLYLGLPDDSFIKKNNCRHAWKYDKTPAAFASIM